MSAICAVVRLDGAPVDRQQFERMTAASDYRGPDGIQHWIQGHVGLAHLALNTTPESLRERQPLVHAARHMVLVADARVDNLRELIDSLRLRGDAADPEPTDADLILAAYDRWGTDCPKQLIGDFAFAVWDLRRQRLFCARDPLGVRALHYYQRGRDLIIATTPESIIGWLGERPPVNDAYLQDLVARDLARGITESAYRDLHRLPPAHSLSISDGRVTRSRYWTLGAQPGPAFRRDADYIEAFRALFEQSVTACLRSADPVGLLVSGGVDSSSIACMADRLLGLGTVDVPIRLYSSTFETTPRADEREYILGVVDHCRRIESTLIPSDDCWALKEFGTDGGFRLINGPELGVNRTFEMTTQRAMRAQGARVCVSGFGADQLLGSGAYHTPRNLRTLPFARLPSELRHFVRHSRRPAWQILGYAWMRPWLPDAAVTWLHRMLSPSPQPLCMPTRPLAPNPLPAPTFDNAIAASTYQVLTGIFPSQLLAASDRASQIGLEMRQPFLDRRLVEFVLALPPRLLFREGTVKFILREALAGTLVERVRSRKGRAEFSALWDLGFRGPERARVQALLKESRVVDRGYLCREQLEQRWAAYWSGTGDSQAGPLTGFLVTEAWLRDLE